MDIKFLLGVLNRPWMMEPSQASYWSGVATAFLEGRLAGVPNLDTRKRYEGQFEDMFRVNQSGTVMSDGPVYVIRMNGPIAKYGYCGAPGSQDIQQAIRAANQDETVQSIVLWIDSPGGQVDGTANLAQEVKNSAKPVVAFADGMMASAAYWIGSSAREIIVDKANDGFNTLIGSIGTMASWVDRTRYNENQGIKVHTVYASKSTDKNRMFDEANAGNYTDMIQMLDNVNETFLAAVEQNRAGKINPAKENVLTGKVYEGKDAIRFGLADRMGDFQTAVKRSIMLAKTIAK